MKNTAKAALTLATLLALAACKPQGGEPAAPSGDEPAASATADGDAAPGKAQSFDINSVPVSGMALGEFPYFGFPAGYKALNPPEKRDMDRFPFWVGDRFEWAEGKVWSTNLGTDSGKEFSEFEFRKNLDAMMTSAGGAKVFDGQVPSAAAEGLGSGIMVDRVTGIGDIGHRPSTVYLLRRADRNIWVYLNTFSAGGSWTVAETTPFVATAALIPAAALKQQLDSAGKVALQVNFATDKTEMLPDSLPQIDQVVQLLKDDPALKLAVNGHTDNTGDAAHNQKLSAGRANAVVAALVAKGVDAARLSAKGFGQEQPVADNATEEGKAKNRRVELVKQA